MGFRSLVNSCASYKLAAALALSACALLPSFATAQPNQGGNGNGINISAGPAGGIKVDAKGVVDLLAMPDDSTQTAREKAASIRAAPQEAGAIVKPSAMRMISLTRLEKAIAAKLAKNERLDEEMLNLAGLVRVQYVFVYPDTKDIVIAGPAEGYMSDPTGRVIGIETGRAVVQLEDLVVALRAFGPSAKAPTVIGCSIDPTKEGLANLQKSLIEVGKQMRTKPTPQQANNIANHLRDALGLQNVTVNGISPKTHMAKVLVEADYKMKLIGIGIDNKPVKNMKSYVDVANPAAVSRNALKRWYFVPNYECVRVADDNQAMELVGEGVKLVGDDEVVSNDGGRTQTGTADAASKTFTESFTKAYPEIARRATVYGELRNIIDLSVAAAFMQKHDFFAKADWKMEVLGDETKFATETHHAPKQVSSACIALAKGARVSFPIGGGVHVQPKLALNTSNLLQDEDGSVMKRRENVTLDKLAEGQWWWD